MLDADPKAIQQINFIGNLAEYGNKTVFLIIEKSKETNRESIVNLFCFNIISVWNGSV